MAPNYSLIREITDARVDYAIRVRASRIWTEMDFARKNILATNVVFIDEEGDQILLKMRKYQKNKFESMFEEQQVYTIINFKVVQAPLTFKVISGEKAINFYCDTKIIHEASIQKYKFDLATFDDVKAKVGNNKNLIDIAGRITAVTHKKTASQGLNIIELIITNESGQELTITLWEEIAAEFDCQLNAYPNQTVFVTVTSTTAKLYLETAYLSSTRATQVYINIDHEAIHFLCQIQQNVNGENNQITVVKRVDAKEERTIAKLETMTIQEVLHAKLPDNKDDMMCLCEALIESICEDDGWYYMACKACLRKLKEIEGRLYCDRCNIDDVVPIAR